MSTVFATVAVKKASCLGKSSERLSRVVVYQNALYIDSDVATEKQVDQCSGAED